MTKLKTPITLTIDTVEKAISVRIGLRLNPSTTEASRRVRMSTLSQDAPSLSDHVEAALVNQGIDWRTWEPPAPISIGEHPVEFKPDGVQVGCTFVSKETVLAIVRRLNSPVKPAGRNAVINVHGDETLSRIVQEMAIRAGFQAARSADAETKLLDASYHSLIFETGQRIHANYKHRPFLGMPLLDARTQFGEVVDFFRQAAAPIKIKDEVVEFSESGISVLGHAISRETVLEIAKRLEAP